MAVTAGTDRGDRDGRGEGRGRGDREAPGRGVVFDTSGRQTIGYRVIRGLAVFVMRVWLRPRVTGTERVPKEGPVILAPVHRSFVDFSFVYAVTRRKVFFMAKDTLWRSNLLGRFLLSVGAFPVHRGAADREAMGHAEEVLRGGQVLLMFPEGTRQEGPTVEELHDGVAFVAARTGATVVPLGIGGSDLAMPKGQRFPRPRPVTLYVGEPLDPPPRAPSGRTPRSTLQGYTAQLREAIQDAYDRARTAREALGRRR